MVIYHSIAMLFRATAVHGCVVSSLDLQLLDICYIKVHIRSLTIPGKNCSVTIEIVLCILSDRDMWGTNVGSARRILPLVVEVRANRTIVRVSIMHFVEHHCEQSWWRDSESCSQKRSK